jgi:hypothetical protein
MKITVAIEQEFLAALVQKSKEVDFEILDDISPDFFSVDSYKWFIKKMKDRNWEPAEFPIVDDWLINDIKDDDKKNIFREQIWGLYSIEITFAKDANERFRTFLAYSLCKSSMKSGLDGFERTSRIDYMVDELAGAVKKATALIKQQGMEMVDWAENYDQRTKKRILERNNPNISPVIRTGIRELDVQFAIKAPMIIDFFAPFKRYKSIVLNSMGFSALLQGFNVLHVVYENTIELTSARYDSLFSGLSYDRVNTMALSKDEKAQMDATFNWINSWGSRLKIIKCTPKGTSIPEIEEKIDRLKLRESFSPDVLILDYINIVASSKKTGQERLDQAQIVWDLKHLADTYNLPVITASQSRMDGVNSDRLGMEHRGKSIDISQGVNLSIAINQTDQEKEDDLLVFCPLFSREYEITIPEVVVDCDLNRMAICRDFGYLWEIAAENFPIT